MKKKYKVLIAASEVFPFAKTGGLADVTGALPKELNKLGVEVKVIMPKYRMVKEYLRDMALEPERVTDTLFFNVGWRHERVSVDRLVSDEGIEFFFIDKSEYYDREFLYNTSHGNYPDNAERFSTFCSSVLHFIKFYKWQPDVIHCNDWQTALIPTYLKTMDFYKEDPFFSKIKTLFTIHNIAYQGYFFHSELNILGLEEKDFHMEGFEFYGNINLMKAGLVFSDMLNTVSDTYAKEIQNSDFGYGLEGVLAKRKDALHGIINGIDYEFWNPQKSKHIFKNYSVEKLQDKKVNKIELKKECRFLDLRDDVPLIGIVSRLANQKGIDILIESMNAILERQVQFVLLGTGEMRYHFIFEDYMRYYPEHFRAFLKYDDLFAQKIYAACDMFLMPSIFEPCGLGQLIALKFGAVPIVNSTGGLVDTIEEFDLKTKKGTGFFMKEYSSQELLNTIDRALEVYKDKKLWNSLVKNCMKQDFSWGHSAEKYVELYGKLEEKI